MLVLPQIEQFLHGSLPSDWCSLGIQEEAKKVFRVSWKATAFVKELRDGLTVTEKFVLLMLAEYHRTDDKVSWPSVATLAYDCLMEERSVKRILARLEDADFIRRTKGGGRGHFTAYQIVGLDIPKGDRRSVILESLSVETLITEPRNSDLKRRNSDPGGNAIRKERVEPIKQQGTDSVCQKCGGTKVLHQLPHIPGPRLIPCTACAVSV